jgi:hypothetical protein
MALFAMICSESGGMGIVRGEGRVIIPAWVGSGRGWGVVRWRCGWVGVTSWRYKIFIFCIFLVEMWVGGCHFLEVQILKSQYIGALYITLLVHIVA